VPADDPLFAGVDFSLAKPVTVRGRLSESGPGRSYWHGRVTTAVVGPCRRCLTEVRTPIAAELRALFAEESDTADGTATYDLPAGAVELDLAPVIREELILTVPDFVVCREDCQGLCAQCGKNLNEGPCDCRPEPDPRWAALEALRSRWADSEES
jgi:uncharacterized protein